MFTLIVFGSLVINFSLGAPGSQHGSGLVGRIIGGQVANITEFPYMVALEMDGELHCGASILSDSWVVTAAHCIYNQSKDKAEIRAGTSFRERGGSLHRVTDWVSHPEFDFYKMNFDVAILKVAPSFDFDAETQPIPPVDEEPSVGMSGIITGWGIDGITLPEQLEFVSLPIVDREKCKEDYAEYDEVLDTMICAGVYEGGKDSCTLDSGGPLAVEGKLAGIISWGKGCGNPGFPGVYTNIAKAVDFIGVTFKQSSLFS